MSLIVEASIRVLRVSRLIGRGVSGCFALPGDVKGCGVSVSYAQATKLSLKSSKPAQPKASDKDTASVTCKANAQRHTPPSSPKGAVSCPADKPRARKPSKEGAPREPINRFGNDSDMDIDSISDYFSDERKSRSRNTRSLELPLSQSQPQSPARTRSCIRPLPPPHSPTHHTPPLIPPTADGDPIAVNSPPPPPARYPTSLQVVVKQGAGKAANSLHVLDCWSKHKGSGCV